MKIKYMCAFLGVFLMALCFLPINKAQAYSTKTIVIDAGHGGIDTGASSAFNKIYESDLNLEIAKALNEQCLMGGYNVIMTRTSKDGLYGKRARGFKLRDMKKRKEIIESSGADIVVSLHLNKCEAEYRMGSIVFYRKKDEQSRLLAESIQESVNQLYEKPKDKCLPQDYYILNCIDKPSVLIECGFLSNRNEEKLLRSAEYQKRLANKIFEGIEVYFNNTSL